MKQGVWRGVLLMDANDSSLKLPFTFTFTRTEDGKMKMEIVNAEERIDATEINLVNDSIHIKLPVFEDEIFAKIIKEDSISGSYLHYGSKSKYPIPFYGIFGKTDRFPGDKVQPVLDIDGRWDATFQPGEKDEYKAVGEFKQRGFELRGTFLTSSGDYRYLDGAVSGNQIMLSCLDGAHSLLFKATITPDGKIDNGLLVGGPAWREKWIAVRNDKAELPDPEKLISLKPGVDNINFSMFNMNGEKVTLDNEKYKNKAVILQIMGSWCPNCMDETRLLAKLYDTYKPLGLEIIGLCYESNDFNAAKPRIERFSKQLNAKYDFLYAGEVGNKSVLETLPFLSDFKGYPTTIYLDKNHKVTKIYTGFEGPGTGQHYEKLKNDITQYIEKLLKS
jgi:thiol-disulfide isomerase/thioredoxin